MKLRTIRENLGLSQNDLADKMDVRQSAVSMWETGESTPSHKNLLKLAAVLGCTVDALLSDHKTSA